MKEMLQRFSPVSALVFTCCCCAGLTSCNFFKRSVSMVSDTVTAPQSDNVIVEKQGSPAAATAAAASSHTDGSILVRKGDTLSSLAKRNGVSVADLCSVNGITRNSVLRAGQSLRLPRNAAAAAAGKALPSSSGGTYTVQPGETLSTVAHRHHVSIAQLLRANGLTPEQADHVRAGQVLRLPAGH